MQYSEALAERPIWIALSKVDQLEAEELETMLEAFAETFPERPIYGVSALGDIGLPELCQDLMLALQENACVCKKTTTSQTNNSDSRNASVKMCGRIQSTCVNVAWRRAIRENSDDLDDEDIFLAMTRPRWSMSATKTKDTTRQMLAPCKRVVVKVGSSLLTGPDNGLQVTKIDAYATQIAKLAATGHQVTLVSSGAVAAGCLRLGWNERPQQVHLLQAAASVGQMGLVQSYESTLRKYGCGTAMIMLTHDDLSRSATLFECSSHYKRIAVVGDRAGDQ